MTKNTMFTGVGILLLAGLGLTVFAVKPVKKAVGEGVCSRTRRTYADSEDKHERIRAKEQAEFFHCNWTTPQGLVEIEVERGNPQAIKWAKKWGMT